MKMANQIVIDEARGAEEVGNPVGIYGRPRLPYKYLTDETAYQDEQPNAIIVGRPRMLMMDEEDDVRQGLLPGGGRLYRGPNGTERSVFEKYRSRRRLRVSLNLLLRLRMFLAICAVVLELRFLISRIWRHWKDPEAVEFD